MWCSAAAFCATPLTGYGCSLAMISDFIAANLVRYGLGSGILKRNFRLVLLDVGAIGAIGAIGVLPVH